MTFVTPCILSDDQTVNVVLDSEGGFVRLEVVMPPRVNYERMPEPTRQLELERRTAEWAALRSKRFA